MRIIDASSMLKSRRGGQNARASALSALTSRRGPGEGSVLGRRFRQIGTVSLRDMQTLNGKCLRQPAPIEESDEDKPGVTV
jgi:hypothetical protein